MFVNKKVRGSNTSASGANRMDLRIAGVLFCLLAIYFYSRSRHSLSLGGSIAAVLLGLPIGIHSIPLFGALIAFFFVCVVATKWATDLKFQRTGAPHATQRSIGSVLANGLVASCCCLAALLAGQKQTPWLTDAEYHINLTAAALGAIGASCGDTLASEMAVVVADRDPVLITAPWRRVPTGTNGGVTGWGIRFSFAGGLIVYWTFSLLSLLTGETSFSWAVATFLRGSLHMGITAVVASLVDSLLGAVFQETMKASWISTAEVIEDISKRGTEGIEMKQEERIARSGTHDGHTLTKGAAATNESSSSEGIAGVTGGEQSRRSAANMPINTHDNSPSQQRQGVEKAHELEAVIGISRCVHTVRTAERTHIKGSDSSHVGEKEVFKDTEEKYLPPNFIIYTKQYNEPEIQSNWTVEHVAGWCNWLSGHTVNLVASGVGAMVSVWLTAV